MDGATSSLLPREGVPSSVFARICLFNHGPADYLHPSHRAEFAIAALAEDVWAAPRARSHLSRSILARLGVDACTDVSRAEWPLALLDPPRLARLARHVAAGLLGSRARACISRADVIEWRDWLSPQAHEFALTSANLLPLAHAPEIAREGTAEDLGFRWIRAAIQSWPDPIRLRMQLKLPAQTPAPPGQVPREQAQRLVRSILSIVEQSWCSSFVKTRA
ncbi:MAG: SctK family type III secretion system sorting platform protein [Pseudomonadota bacterium]